MKRFFGLILCLFFAAPFAQAGNLHIIDRDTDTGFEIYRSGNPDEDDVAELCRLGVDEMMVMSGNAEKHELKHLKACPTLKIVYNESQDAKVPLTRGFLEDFDRWVADAKATGKKIAFRCACGCHRTGRLAAYYQMKYQNLTPEDAIVIMNKWGKYMFLHPQLKPQVRALYDFILGRKCTTDAKHCVIE